MLVYLMLSDYRVTLDCSSPPALSKFIGVKLSVYVLITGVVAYPIQHTSHCQASSVVLHGTFQAPLV